MKTFTIKRIMLSVLICCIGLFAAACGNSNSSSGKTVKLAYNLWIGSAGLFVADEKKIFEEKGVSVELVQFAAPTEAVQALISGEVDVALTTLDTAVMLKGSENKNDPFKLINITDLSNGADGIVGNSSIKTVADLKGKSVAATVGAVNHFLLINALHTVGLTEADINLVNMAPDMIGPAVISKSVEAGVVWEPFLSEAQADGANLLFSSADVPDLIIDGMVTTQSMIDNRKEELVKIVDAIEAGSKFFHDHPDEGVAIAAKLMGTSVDSVSKMSQGVKLLTKEQSTDILVTNVEITKKTIQQFSDFFIAQKLIKKAVDPDGLIDPVLFQ